VLLALATGDPVTQAILNRYEDVKRNLVEAAEAMPEEHYSFRLTEPQRTFAEWIGHTALAIGSCGGSRPATKAATKAELIQALKDAFAGCDRALGRTSDRKVLADAVSLIATLNAHYGNLVGYLRVKGITPPSTARRTMRIPERGGNQPPPETAKPPAKK
jgi:hypothetical protein